MSRPESEVGQNPDRNSGSQQSPDRDPAGDPNRRAAQPSDLDSLLALGSPTSSGPSEAVGSTGPAGGQGSSGATDADAIGELQEIDVDAIVPNEFQPRRRFDDEALASLTDSIRELGVLQPILVRPEGDGLYELIAGERRWRAARLAGLPTVPAVIRRTEDQGSLEQAIVENLHREDLTALEEAYAYQQLVDDFGLTQDEVAARVGKSRSAVSNTLRLFRLPMSVQKLIGDGRLSAGHARAVLGLELPADQLALTDLILAEDLSVRAAERAAKTWDSTLGGPESSKSGRNGGTSDGVAEDRGSGRGRAFSAGALEVQQALEDLLSTRVEVSEAVGNGRIVIRFADEEDLDRIFRLLTD